MRVIGLDVGGRRIGVASGDTDTRLAVPVGVVIVEPGDSGVAGVLREAEAREASVIVVGMPYSMSGRVGPQAESVEEFVRLLREAGARVETVDERLSSAEAERSMRRSRAPGRGHRRPVKGDSDAAAAVVILQSWLDGGGGTGR